MHHQTRLLLVEDEVRLADNIYTYLRRLGYNVDHTSGGRDALERNQADPYDCILLDLSLPGDMDGIDVCRRLRRDGVQTPVLMLTARDALSSRVEGLDAGADDYLVKPFALEEMAARIRALLRRAPRSAAVFLEHGDIRLDSAGRSAERNGHHVTLTAREYAMLELFMRRPNELLTRDEISRHVWDDNYDPASNIIDVYVARLRTKLEAHGGSRVIHTMRGQGYIFRIQDEV